MKKLLIITLIVSFALIGGMSVNAARPFLAPSGLNATAISSSQINLTWVDNSSDEAGFSIERSTDGANFSEIGTVGSNIVSYNNTNLNSNTAYYYKVRAWKTIKGQTVYSNYSNTDSDTTFDVAPNAPTNLEAGVNYASSSPYVSLTWTDNADNETGFSIERSTNGVDFNELNTVSMNVTYYHDWSVSTSSTYYYKVRAYNGVGNSDYSNTVSAFDY